MGGDSSMGVGGAGYNVDGVRPVASYVSRHARGLIGWLEAKRGR